MIIVLMLTVISAAVIKVINYGRWAGKQGNKRGALGLYIFAIFVVLIPTGVYILTISR